jgi:hypothetical protein
MNRVWLNAGLGLVVVGLGAAVWFGDKKDAPKAPLTALAPSAVTAISIEHPNSPAIKLEKQDGSWKLVAPVKADTDQFEVAALVNLADTSRQAELTDGGLDYKSLGLDPAAFRITLNDHTLDFGGDEPIKYRRYVRVDGGTVALIENPSSAAVDKDYSDLVSKSVVPPGLEITRIAVPGLTIEKDVSGQWRSPEYPDAKATDLQSVIDAWKNAKSMWNGADPKEASDDGSKGDAIKLALADGSEVDYLIVSRDPQFLLSRPDLGIRYTIAKTETDKLLALPKPPQPEAAPDSGTADDAGDPSTAPDSAAPEAAPAH